MLWVLLAIGAHLCWAFGNIGDKFVVSKKISNPYVYIVWMVLLGASTMVFIPFVNFRLPTIETFFILAIAGALYFYGGFPYIKAMQMEEPTRINIWWGLIPIFSLLIGRLFFNEQFTGWQLLAFCLLVGGTAFASLHFKSDRKVSWSKAVWLMALAALAFAIYGVLFRFVTNEVTFAQGFIWINIIQFLCALTMFVFPKFRQDFLENIKKADKTLVGVILGLFSVEKFGILLNQWALSLSSAALVFAMEGFQVLFVFIIASLLSVFLPNIVKEELDKQNLLLKISALILMVSGILLLAFS